MLARAQDTVFLPGILGDFEAVRARGRTVQCQVQDLVVQHQATRHHYQVDVRKFETGPSAELTIWKISSTGLKRVSKLQRGF